MVQPNSGMYAPAVDQPSNHYGKWLVRVAMIEQPSEKPNEYGAKS